ncbi:putative G-protein coupled receptor 116, partial [Egretta garzetta]
EYTIDIEVSLMDSSFLEPIREYFRNLSLPVSTNISDVEITNINITTVCLSSGDNNSCCSCENGYAWPSAVCSGLVACPSVSLEPALPCGYMKEMPFYGPYCEPQTKEPIVMIMSVRLNISFQDDLGDPSSVLYNKYKADLEKAFNASYRCLPGFVSATVTGFRPGSVIVNYEVKAGAASFSQIANSNRIVPQFLDAYYQLDQATFTIEMTNHTNFTVIPVDIFQGDTVKLICEINSTSENVTWYFSNQTITTNSRYLIEAKASRSILTIKNTTIHDSGSYKCVFTKRKSLHTLVFKDTKPIEVSLLNISSNFNNIDVTCNNPEMQTNSPVLSCCIDRHLPSLTGDWKVNGTINISGVSSFSENCTEYKLNINESLCPPKDSGAVTTYTCELRTGHGARGSRDIRVTYLRRANVKISSAVNSVSEGHGFNLTCESDISNYDSISWKIQSGNNTKTVDCDTCINSSFSAMSVLTVKAATLAWNGTFICTFSQKNLESSANKTIQVFSLPLKQNIMINPIEAPIQCNKPEALQCCIRAHSMEDYNVTFMVEHKEVPFEKEVRGNLSCYTYNYMESDCSKENLTASCKFFNHIEQGVESEFIRLNLIDGNKVSCSDNLGSGIEGSTLIKPCYNLNDPYGFTQGRKTYTCSNKSWKLKADECLSVAINNVLTEAEVTFMSFLEPRANLPKYLEELKNTVRQEQTTRNISSADLGTVVVILDKISPIPANATETNIENFLCIVDMIVANSTTAVWETLTEKNISIRSSLLQSVEKFCLHLQPVNNTIPPVSASTLQLQGLVTKNNTDYNKNFVSTENLTVNVYIGETEIQTLTHNSVIVSVMYSSFGRILSLNEPESVNGLLITTTVQSNSSRQKFDVNMTFAKKNSSPKNRCVFWNFTLNELNGGWDGHGCTSTEEEDYVICTCNHLTSFSILMSGDQSPQSEIEDYITYIGLAISILSLVACIIIESLVWKYVTNNTTSYMRHVCMLNIATSLLIADIWFIVTAALNDQMSKDTCFVATFFIHLFYLCVFFWMLSLGLILFYRLVFILHNTSKTTQKVVSFCLGYGCPFLIAVITIAVTQPRNSYIRTGVCWLNWKDSKAVLAFIIPALIIVAMNLFITTVVIIKILRPTIGDRSNRQEKNSLFQIGKSVAILTPLLGLTWGFGLATVVKNNSRAFHILFSLLNALQGLFILVFATLWDKKIQEALLKRNSMSKWSSQQTKVRSL